MSDDVRDVPAPEEPVEVEKAQRKMQREGVPERSAQSDEWDVVDEQSWESFPGSDPPSSWAGRDIEPERPLGHASKREGQTPRSSK